MKRRVRPCDHHCRAQASYHEHMPELADRHAMGSYGLDWIGQLPAALEQQQTILRGLLTLCEADDRIRWLVIGCSLARGAGDSLSDVDVAIGVRGEEFDAT